MSDNEIDFDAVELFVGFARRAQESGDGAGLVAARKLILVAMGVGDQPPHYNTKHLRPSPKS